MFSWKYDQEHFIYISNGESRYDIRPSNTLLYSYDEIHSDADHIFRIVGETETSTMGLRIWRNVIDSVFGEDSYDEAVEEFLEHGFEMDDSDEPAPSDIKAWEQYTGISYDCRPVIERIVTQAMDGLEAEARYYLNE